MEGWPVRAYGPHRVEDEPRTVLVGAKSGEHPEPVDPRVTRLRRQVNSHAWHVGQQQP